MKWSQEPTKPGLLLWGEWVKLKAASVSGLAEWVESGCELA